MKLPARLTYLCCFCLFLIPAAYGQIDGPVADSTAGDTLPDIVRPPAVYLGSDTVLVRDTLFRMVEQYTFSLAGTEEEDSDLPPFKIFPWEYNMSLHARITSTDSTLRWQVWPNWVYKKNRDPGVFSYRLGTIGRTNAYLHYAHEPQYQQLFWEDVSLNDPVSGTVNWDVIPLHKLSFLYENDTGINHVTGYVLKQHYLSQPLSQLIYRESKFNTRSLEFLVSQNFGAQTNAEISYWDRRDGGEYSNSEVGGRQIFARVYHLLDHRQLIKVHLLSNSYTIDEPFGYGITDLARFAFDPYMANPQQTSAESELSASNIAINYYRRGADTTHVSPESFRAGIFFNSRKRDLTYSVDSTFYKVQSIGINAHKWLNLNPLYLDGSISNELFMNGERDRSDLEHGNWNVFSAKASATLRPLPLLEISGSAEIRNRSDGFISHTLYAGVSMRPAWLLRASAGISQGTVMPTPQQLYWSSLEYRGNPGLVHEKINKIEGSVSLDLSDNVSLGVKGQLKDIRDGIMIEGDSTFANMAPYNSAAASVFFDFNSNRFELTGSASYHQYGRFIQPHSAPLPMDGNSRIWLKGGAYVKGYLFSRATYVKAGLWGMISPLRYQAGHYNPVLDYWQAASNDQYLPPFDRLDLDISARLRSIMITLRWENILDDVSQLGYFETAQYPMGRRRFIFGFRAFFRN